MKKVLFTIKFGNYDPVREPLIITKGWDYIIFTDQDIESKVFEVRKVKTEGSGHLQARDYYINATKYLPEYDFSIMTGGQIQVNCNLDEYLKLCDLGCDFNMMRHCRDCIFKEAEECKKFYGEAGKKLIELQMQKYKDQGMPERNGLFAHGVIARHHNKPVEMHERKWWQEVSNPEHVKRDQLSFMYVLWKYRYVSIYPIGEYWELIHKYFKIFSHGTWKQL